jgi:hypothetical protein
VAEDSYVCFLVLDTGSRSAAQAGLSLLSAGTTGVRHHAQSAPHLLAAVAVVCGQHRATEIMTSSCRAEDSWGARVVPCCHFSEAWPSSDSRGLQNHHPVPLTLSLPAAQLEPQLSHEVHLTLPQAGSPKSCPEAGIRGSPSMSGGDSRQERTTEENNKRCPGEGAALDSWGTGVLGTWGTPWVTPRLPQWRAEGARVSAHECPSIPLRLRTAGGRGDMAPPATAPRLAGAHPGCVQVTSGVTEKCRLLDVPPASQATQVSGAPMWPPGPCCPHTAWQDRHQADCARWPRGSSGPCGGLTRGDFDFPSVEQAPGWHLSQRAEDSVAKLMGMGGRPSSSFLSSLWPPHLRDLEAVRH